MRKRPRLEELHEAQREAQEKTRTLVAKIRARAAARALAENVDSRGASGAQAPILKDSVATPQSSSEGYLSARVKTDVLRVARGEVTESLVATRPLVTLADIVLECAQKRDRRSVLLWPAQPSVLPLAHVLATTARWAAGDKKGLRALWYPAATNVFHGLNEYFFDTGGFGALTAELYEDSNQPNPLIARSLRSKDSLFFAVKSAESGTRPSLAELIPHFFFAGKTDSWESFGSRYLDEFLRTLKRRQHAQSIRHVAAELGQPDTAPDALFALHYSLDRNVLTRQARHMTVPPEIITIPLMRRDRGRFPKWSAMLKSILAVIEHVFASDAPGILIVTDEPLVHQRATYILTHRSKKARRSSAVNHVTASALLWPHEDDGWRSASEAEFQNADPRNFEVQLVDQESSATLADMSALLGEEDLSDAVKEELRMAQRFVAMLSTLCGTRAVLANWIAEHESRERTESVHTWPPYRHRLAALASDGDFGRHRDQLEATLKAVDALWAAADRGMPMLHALLGELRLLEHSTKRLVVVLPTDKERQLLRLLLKDDFQLADLEASGRVRIEVPWSVGACLAAFRAKRVVFAGLFRSATPVLLTDNRLPKEIVVILTTRNAEYLLQTFDIVMQEEGLRRIRARVRALSEQILIRMARRPRTRSTIDDYARDPNPAQRKEGIALANSNTPDAWQLTLEDGERLSLGADSTVHQYDPRHGARLDRAFTPVKVSNLTMGAEILVAPPELRDALEDALRAHGTSTRLAGSADVLLKAYHREVRVQVETIFPRLSVTDQERAIRQRMQELAGPGVKLPISIRYWIDVGSESHDASARPTVPHGPQARAHFMLFAKVLEMRDSTAELYWEEAIVKARVAHVRDGRRLASRWERVLLDTTGVLSFLGLSPQEVDRLLHMAAAHVRRLVKVQPPVTRSVA